MTCPQPVYGSAPEHTVRSFVAPSAVTTTTFTHTQVGATLVGCMVIPEDGRAQNQQRWVTGVSGTTATIDKPWFDVTGTTAIRAWLLPEVPARVTTASAAAVISSDHAAIAAEPDGYWVGYQAVCIAGANVGKAFTITAWTAATGSATVAGLTLTVIGDLFVFRRQVRLGEVVTVSVETGANARTVIGTGTRGADMAMILANKATISLTVEQRPLATAGASTVQAAPPIEMGDLLRDHFTEAKDTGGTVASIDASGFVGTGGLWSVNGFALFQNGKAAQIWSTSTGLASATVTKYGTGQAGFANVSTSSVVYGGVSYTRKDTGFIHRLWDLYRGGKVKQALYGTMPTLKIMLNRQEAAKFMFAYSVSDAFEWNADRPVALNATNPLTVPDLGVPTSGQGARCVIDGVSVIMQSIELDMGLVPGERPSLSGVMQNDGCVMDVKEATGTIKIYADQDENASFQALKDRMRSGRPFSFLYQRDTAAGRTFCIGTPSMQFTGGTYGYDGTPAQGMFTMPFQCVDPALAVDYGNVALYPTATYPGLRSISIAVI